MPPPNPAPDPGDVDAAEVAAIVRKAALTTLPADWTHLPGTGEPAHVALCREASRLWRAAKRRQEHERRRTERDNVNDNDNANTRGRGHPTSEDGPPADRAAGLSSCATPEKFRRLEMP
jgi:hypothetical protein